MTSRIRKNSKKLKRSLKKNKYIGGITSLSGLYGFFVNKAEWIKLFGNVEKDKDAPSIKDIEDKLKGKGYIFKNRTRSFRLIGAGIKTQPLSRHCKSVMYGIPADETDTWVNECRAAFLQSLEYNYGTPFYHKANIHLVDTEIQDVLTLIQYHDLFSDSPENKDKRNTLNIDCCVLIDVKEIRSNRYIKIVEYNKVNIDDVLKLKLNDMVKNSDNIY